MKKSLVSLFILSTVILGYLVSANFEDLFAKKAPLDAKVTSLYESNYSKLRFDLWNNGSVLKDQKITKRKDKKNSIVILNFWATWCRPCIKELPSLQELSTKFDKKSLRIVGINTDDEEQKKKVDSMVKKLGIKFDIALNGSKLTEQYNISAIPVSIVYKNGKVIKVVNGFEDFASAEFEEFVKKNLK